MLRGILLAAVFFAVPVRAGVRVAVRSAPPLGTVPAALVLPVPSLSATALPGLAPGLSGSLLPELTVMSAPSPVSAVSPAKAAEGETARALPTASGPELPAPKRRPRAAKPLERPVAASRSREDLERKHPKLAERFRELDAAFNAAEGGADGSFGGGWASFAVRAGARLRSSWTRLRPRKSPPIVHAGIRFTKGGVEIAVAGEAGTETAFLPVRRGEAAREVSAWIAAYARRTGAKVASAGLAGVRRPGRYASKLWLADDIVPVFLPEAVDASAAARAAASQFSSEGGVAIRKVDLAADGEVVVPDLVSARSYRDAVDPADWKDLVAAAKRFEGRVSFFSSTPRGGGVALMRHALVRLLRLVGVDARWYVLEPDLEVFAVTKRKFHNQLQGVAAPGDELADADRAMLQAWWDRNAAKFERVFRDSKVIVIDDYQPSGLIPYIKKANPGAKILYRSHIQIQGHLVDRQGTPQRAVWDFLWENIRLADTFISHPLRAFVPSVVPEAMRVYLPATTDPVDGLNKDLSEPQIDYYLDAYDRRLGELGQAGLDRRRAYAAQIARFDPSKGIDVALEGYARLRARLRAEGVPDSDAPQLVFAGHGAIDDVQGMEIYRKTMELIRRRYPALAGDIKAAPMPAVDQVLNAIRRRSAWLEQLSIAEGWEINVTEAGMKGKPILGSRAGGIPLQIADGETGIVVELGDPKATADAMYRLWKDRTLRERLGAAALARKPRVHTIHAAIRWLTMGLGEVPADAGIKPLW